MNSSRLFVTSSLPFVTRFLRFFRWCSRALSDTLPDMGQLSRAWTVAPVLCLFLAPFVLRAAPPPDPQAREFIRRMEDILRGTTSQARVEIRIVRPRFTRTLVVDSWEDRGQKRSFLRIVLPKKDQGVAFLKLGDRLWQYVPKIGRELRIEGSLLQDSWMGSDFTNDDLVRSSSTLDDYTHSFLPAPNPKVRRILLTPRAGSTVPWGKVIIELEADSSLPLRQELYDHRDRLVKEMEFSEVRVFGGRKLPTYFVMHTVRDGRRISSTSMRYVRLDFDAAIPASVFSRSNLRR